MNDAKTWPPDALNEDAIGFVYNHAYEHAACQQGDSVEEAHNEACRAVYKHGFHNATGGTPEHPKLTELRDAALEILFEFPDGDDSDDSDVNRIVTRERRDRLEAALDAFARARGEGLCTCTDGSCAQGATPT
jgi:hypothetical protein